MEKNNSLLPPAWITTLLFVIFILYLLSSMKELLVLLVVGYSIAFAMDPLVSFLQRKKISRALGTIIVLIAFAGIIAGLLVTVVPSLIREALLLIEHLPDYILQAKEFIRTIPSQFEGRIPNGIQSKLKMDTVVDSLPMVGKDSVMAVLSGIGAALLKGYSVTLTIVNLALLPLIVFYFSEGLHRFHKELILFLPREHRLEVRTIFSEVKDLLRGFISGQLIVGVILFCYYALSLSLLGVNFWFLIAVISGFGQIIPYLGLIVGITLSTIIIAVSQGTFSAVLLVWLIYGIGQILEGFVITPKIVGEKVGMNPLEIIIALFAGGSLLGLLGIFLAVPVAASLKVIFRHAHQKFILDTDS